ncbi:hypothetical protein HDA43_002632 [Streptosporangium sandarakinum]|uniref:Uncharacterized protein n=1 Tax=Streptosporangium sandarakinum TaxID=1260955 RepID=A0A852UZA8_9ACTN|nr:hypothetical protein [Streptosporangium sandarakinum]
MGLFFYVRLSTVIAGGLRAFASDVRRWLAGLLHSLKGSHPVPLKAMR